MRNVVVMLMLALFSYAAQAQQSVVLNSPEWMAPLKVDKARLEKVEKAVEHAMTASIDERVSCGNDPLGCYARAAMEWTVDGVKYREIVVIIHNLGANARYTVHQIDGQWPDIVVQ